MRALLPSKRVNGHRNEKPLLSVSVSLSVSTVHSLVGKRSCEREEREKRERERERERERNVGKGRKWRVEGNLYPFASYLATSILSGERMLWRAFRTEDWNSPVPIKRVANETFLLLLLLFWDRLLGQQSFT